MYVHIFLVLSNGEFTLNETSLWSYIRIPHISQFEVLHQCNKCDLEYVIWNVKGSQYFLQSQTVQEIFVKYCLVLLVS